MKYILIGSGFLCVTLGVIGIFLPLLPTTPFLLLAAYLFAKSSEKLHDRLLSNRYLGKYLKGYLKDKTIPTKAKFISILLMWAAILFCVFSITKPPVVDILLILTAMAVSIHIASFKSPAAD